MKRNEVRIGAFYRARVQGNESIVKVLCACTGPEAWRGGWTAQDESGRVFPVRSYQLREEVDPPTQPRANLSPERRAALDRLLSDRPLSTVVRHKRPAPPSLAVKLELERIVCENTAAL